MARKLPRKDVVIIGLGWTGSIMAEALTAAGIGHQAYYRPPLHLQPALAYLGHAEGELPETEKASRENLCLPLWAGISEEQQAEVVAVLRRAVSLVGA